MQKKNRKKNQKRIREREGRERERKTDRYVDDDDEIALTSRLITLTGQAR